MRLVICAYWTEDDDSLPGLATYLQFMGVIPGAGSIVALSPENANQPGLRRALYVMRLGEAATFDPETYVPKENNADTPDEADQS